MRLLRVLLGGVLVVSCLRAQWTLQTSGTRANLRGIVSLGNGVAWASGAEGAVLRTVDGGQTWQSCTMPPGAEKLDFRAVQAADRNMALVLSSGPGDASRVFKTADGCRTWRLVFTNPDAPNGFFDGMRFEEGSGREKLRVGVIAGDPVHGALAIFQTADYGETWSRFNRPPGLPAAVPGESLFAASNSALIQFRNTPLLVTGGSTSRSLLLAGRGWVSGDIPVRHGDSAGAFSVAARPRTAGRSMLVAVGGDYRRPEDANGTCAVSADGGLHWSACAKPPGGYRSAVAYAASLQAWLCVGPNGADVSRDDGVHWKALRPNGQDAADADRNWSALDLPFVVGPGGRIGRMRVGPW